VSLRDHHGTDYVRHSFSEQLMNLIRTNLRELAH